MAADSPIEPQLLAQLLEIAPAHVEELCAALAEEYRQSGRGFVLVRVAGGYRFGSHPDLAGYVERFVLEGQTARLSAAALETLAIVAYKQPVSRAQIATVRGVNADGVLRTLVQRGFVAEIGRDPGPGQAVLYGTTPAFLERLGLDRIEDLPPLGDFVPAPDVMDALEQSLRFPDEPAKDASTNGHTPALAGDSPAEAVELAEAAEPVEDTATSNGHTPAPHDEVPLAERGDPHDGDGSTSEPE